MKPSRCVQCSSLPYMPLLLQLDAVINHSTHVSAQSIYWNENWSFAQAKRQLKFIVGALQTVVRSPFVSHSFGVNCPSLLHFAKI